MTALAEDLMHEVLRRFEHDLHEAVTHHDARQFAHLAFRAECPGAFGEAARPIVEHERALHDFGLTAGAR